jgi:hypothetical protein
MPARSLDRGFERAAVARPGDWQGMTAVGPGVLWRCPASEQRFVAEPRLYRLCWLSQNRSEKQLVKFVNQCH